MLFTSYGFIAFIAILFILYYLIPKRFQWLLLLCADVVFYACAGWQGLCFMAVTVFVSWASTNLMGASLRRQKETLSSPEGKALPREERRAIKKAAEKYRKRIFVLALLCDLGILAALKYTNFLIGNVNAITGASLASVDWVLPLGISFYTFQTVSYVIDVYWEKIPAERNPLKVALFTSFFPLLIQGPISRFGDLSETLFSEHKADYKQISFGLQRILWGYFKKLVIADRLLIAVTAVCGDPAGYDGAYVLAGALLYAAEHDRHCAGTRHTGEGKLRAPVLFEEHCGVLAALAHLHGNVVQGLHFLSALRCAVAFKAQQKGESEDLRRLRTQALGVRLHDRDVVPHGTVARRCVEFRRVGTSQCGVHLGRRGV